MVYPARKIMYIDNHCMKTGNFPCEHVVCFENDIKKQVMFGHEILELLKQDHPDYNHFKRYTQGFADGSTLTFVQKLTNFLN